MAMNYSEISKALASATTGFDHLFSDEISDAKRIFAEDETPLHLLGLGMTSFLEASLGMESGLMAEATTSLQLSEAGAKKQLKLSSKYTKDSNRFPTGTLWELLNADGVILVGLTQALSESYMGYLQCLYSVNSAHTKYTKLFKIVFPTGLDQYRTPATSRAPSRKPSINSMQSAASNTDTVSVKSTSFFGRWTGGSSLNVPSPTPSPSPADDGPVEDLIISGTAFGYGLFNLVLSLLPAKVRTVVGFFGYDHDRKVALQALAVSATRNDVHSVFASLTLMTYHGIVLLLSGYQADEAHIIKQYRAIVENIDKRYPHGSLWILNRAKILRMSYDSAGALKVLQDGLAVDKPNRFKEADTLLTFELAWTLLSQRKYQESGETFIKLTELNSWSHATYYFIAAGCYGALGQHKKAQELLDAVPALMEKRKVAAAKYLPTEVFIQKHLAFYKEKQQRRTGSEANFAECIKISLAEEMAIFWNTHSRIDKSVAEAHIQELSQLSPPVTIASPYISAEANKAVDGRADLDTPDELAIRSLLLGIIHRTIGEYAASRAFLNDVHKRYSDVKVNTWVGGVSMFEHAVLDLKEMDAMEKRGELGDAKATAKRWDSALKAATERLDQAISLSGSQVDLSSRLDSRIAMLRDEIALKKELLAEAITLPGPEMAVKKEVLAAAK